MNIWHDIGREYVKPDNFTAVIEIPKGSKTKYELDKATGLLRLDRILHTSTHYPVNYGFIPLTSAEDNDPLDVLVLCSETITPLALVQCCPIGYINMVDDGANDEKIIAVPFTDPMYNGYTTIDELPSHVFAEIEHFFSVYKMLEGKDTSVISTKGAKEAITAIESAMKRYAMSGLGRPRIRPM